MSVPSEAPPAVVPRSTDEEAVTAAKNVLDAAAPWKAGMAWWIVVAEGAILAAAGGLLLLAPGFSGNSILAVLGAVLLLMAGITAYRLMRGRVPPDRVAVSAFRSGAGVAVGLAIVVVGLLIGTGDQAETIAVSALLGVGLLVFGITGVLGAIVGRRPGAGFPIASLILTGGMAVVGALLLLGALSGYDQLKSSFQWLGVLLVALGVALLIWGFVLRGRQTAEAEA